MKKNLVFILLSAFLLGIDCRAKQLPFTKGTIKAGNFKLYYERTGKGNAILLLHAGLQDHTMWNEQVKALSTQYEVITFDLPYHGKTTGRDTTLLAQEIIKILLDSLHIQKVSIAGLSMGASVAEDFIIAYPERVNKGFLISAGINGYDKIYPIDSISMDWYNLFSSSIRKGDTLQAAKEFTKAWAEGVYRRKDSLKAPVSKYVYSTTLANLRLHKMEGWPLLQDHPPAMEKLTSIQLPVLIINGDKDLPYITSTSKYLAKSISKAQQIIIKNVAHMLNMEKATELNNLMLNFLKSK